MKFHRRHKLFKGKVEALLNSTRNVDLARDKIEAIYKDILDDYPLANPISVDISVTEKLRNSVFYQTPAEWMSEKHINIDSGRFYLWVEQGEWCLNDECFGIASISDKLDQSEILHRDPDSVRDLKELILAGYWEFSAKELPIFSGPKPCDLDEVLSWDEINILMGTTKENMNVVTRTEWDSIISRERDWLGD